jgi:hypothetical protein
MRIPFVIALVLAQCMVQRAPKRCYTETSLIKGS